MLAEAAEAAAVAAVVVAAEAVVAGCGSWTLLKVLSQAVLPPMAQMAWAPLEVALLRGGLPWPEWPEWLLSGERRRWRLQRPSGSIRNDSCHS